jgi:predicted ribosome quality control (RQC) complex YloA/Tae2 family protein
MQQFQINDWVNLLGSLDYDDFNDESSFEEDITKYERKREEDPQETLLNLEDQIEKLKDHELDLIIEEEAPMQILDLTLQEQHQNILDGLFFEDDDYADWIKCVVVKEDARM